MKEKLEIKLGKETLKELKAMLEKDLESKLFYVTSLGFKYDNYFDETKMYKERAKTLKNLSELHSLYCKIIRLLKDEKYNS